MRAFFAEEAGRALGVGDAAARVGGAGGVGANVTLWPVELNQSMSYVFAIIQAGDLFGLTMKPSWPMLTQCENTFFM